MQFPLTRVCHTLTSSSYLNGIGLQRPPHSGWSAIATCVALTYTAYIVVALAAQQAERSDLIRSPKRALAHTWEGFEL